MRRKEVVARRQPAIVGDDGQRALAHERCKIDAKLTFRRLRDLDRAELFYQWSERVTVGAVRDDMANRDSSLRLLDREVAKVREHRNKLLPMIRTTSGLPRILDHDDPDLRGRFA